MPCYNPLTGYKPKTPNANGKYPIQFGMGGSDCKPIQIPCGQCIGCRLERSRQWAIRCVNEASLHVNNCFITLTYNNEHLNKNQSLNKIDFVNFMKRLRKQYGKDIRFFHCGEYGELFSRPHHHACLFNHDFHDKVPQRTVRASASLNRGGSEGFPPINKTTLYQSAELNKLWPMGFCTIGTVTWESAAYVARYITKKITGDRAADHYGDRLPEYITMSRNPGIGKKWFDLYSADLYNYDHAVIRGGIQCKPAKFYDKLYDKVNPDRLATLKAERTKQACINPDNSRARLNVRKKCTEYKLLNLKRTYESFQELTK
nr:MAG: replication initiator protein [Microviridae sp.]